MSQISSILKMLGSATRVGGGAALGGLAAYDLIGKPVASGLSDLLGGGEAKQMAFLRGEDQRRSAMMHAKFRAQRIQRDMGNNIRQLAAYRPDLLQELAAGQELPKGATVIGGQPRMDLIEMAASQMSTAYTDPSEGTL